MATEAPRGIVFRMPEAMSEEAMQAFRAGALFGLYALETRFDLVAEADRRNVHQLVDEEQWHEVIHTGQGARAHQNDRRKLAEVYRAIERTTPRELIGQATEAADEIEVGVAHGRKGVMVGPGPEAIEAYVDEVESNAVLVGLTAEQRAQIVGKTVSIQVLPDRTGRLL